MIENYFKNRTGVYVKSSLGVVRKITITRNDRAQLQQLRRKRFIYIWEREDGSLTAVN